MDGYRNKEIATNRINSTFIFAFSMMYAIIRYNLFGDVALTQIPSYVTNKALAVSGTIYLLLAAYYHFNDQKTNEKYYSKCGAYLITLHVLISLSLFSKNYYPEFYNDAMLSFNGEMILFSGTVAVLLFWNQNKAVVLRLFMLMFVAIHLFFMGYQDWSSIEKWNGKMPPISLIGFLAATSGMVVYGIRIKRTSDQNVYNRKDGFYNENK